MSAGNLKDRERGLSLDLGSPYVLPDAIQDSKESLHSLSRTLQDPYRHMALAKSPLNSTTSLARGREDKASMSSSSSDGPYSGIQSALLPNARPMSTSTPPPPVRQDSLASQTAQAPALQPPEPALTVERRAVRQQNPVAASSAFLDTTQRTAKSPSPGSAIRKGSNSPEKRAHQPLPIRKPVQSFHRPINQPGILSAQGKAEHVKKFSEVSASDYGDATQLSPPMPHYAAAARAQPQGSQRHSRSLSLDGPASFPAGTAMTDGFEVEGVDFSIQGVAMPPEDPNDNPEQRANRIRSFYKEYFEENKTGPVVRPKADPRHQYENSQIQFEGAYFDPLTGQYHLLDQPHVPAPRPRAMTSHSSVPRLRGGHRSRTSSESTNRYVPSSLPSTRQTSLSSRGGPTAPRKPSTPPTPLQTLPTPHLIRDDSHIFNSIDIAPPVTRRDRIAGRSESPHVQSRPFSPSVRAHTPLASSFSDLTVMPSP